MRRTLILTILFVAATAASAQNLYKLDDIQSGTLLVKTTQPGVYVSAPSVGTDVHLQIRGLILRGEVTQTFHNAEAMCVEAIYAFPLPETAAVDRLRMTIGTRVIEGEIKERKEAEQVYEQARSEGKKASLVSQERPNLFTVAIANIGSQEDVVITIDYQQTVDYKEGLFRTRFPMTIGPRYSPDGVKDVDRITPPTDPVRRNRVKLSVDLDAGFSLSSVTSSYHPIDKSVISGTRYEIKLSEETVRGDHDFELVWKPDLGSEPKSALFVETRTNAQYALVMLMPPSSTSTVRLPKESIFIIDTSGSMEGTSLNEAKDALQFALSHLGGGDRFNIIEFNSVTHPLFATPRPATSDAIEEATRWVNQLHSDGGTEMLPALEAALVDDHPNDDGTVRQVVFMTDGQVGNEDELFALIRTKLGRSRLFTVGIGAAPNSHFMRSAARFGRGTFTYIGGVAEVEEKMTSLFTKLESPVLTNVALHFDDPKAEMWPEHVPDLYAGEPVIVTVRLSRPGGRALVSGSLGTREWNDAHTLGMASDESGVAKLWAREKIEALTESMIAAENSDVKQQVIDLALTHHLVTQFTSLVAVDVTPAGTPLEQCATRAVPVNLPQGSSDDDGSLPATATPAPLLLILGSLLIGAATVIARKS